jgi:hypothetical protein
MSSTNGVHHPVRPPPAKVGEFLSPALARAFGGPPAYEIKFVLPAPLAEQVETWARRHLEFDPYTDPDRGHSYRVHTLYFDTPRLDMFCRVPGHKRHKFRVRRYGFEPLVYLERKSRTGDRVVKRRTRIVGDELTLLAAGLDDWGWPGHWFRRRLEFRGLRPTCRVSYDRVAHVGRSPTGTLRLTLDRHVRCAPADGLAVGELPVAGHPLAGRPALNGEVIVELKYREAMPALFKGLLIELGLAPRQASKYRLGATAWDLATEMLKVGLA